MKQVELPLSKESEMMVLGCMLQNEQFLKIGSETLNDSDFYCTEHKTIFSVLKEAYYDKRPMDTHLVCEELKDKDKLKSIGGVAYITTLAQYSGTSGHIEAYCEILKAKTILRRLILETRKIEKDALDEPPDVQGFLEVIQETFKKITNSASICLPIISIAERQKNHDALLEKNRGKKHLGLKVKTIKELNDDMSGLRGLMLLAAAPNAGKTALTIQLGLEILSENPEACLIYVSLEMGEDSIFTRMNLYHSGLNFKTYVLGGEQIESETNHEHLFTPEDIRKMKFAKDAIEKYGRRLQIIDQKTCPNISSKILIDYIENVKISTKCKRAIVIVDYLQVWPIPENKRSSSDIEADKWRIGEIKKISDALNAQNHDPVIVISEARKPDAGKEWGGYLSDVMGSARGTYTPDAVLLLSQLEETALKKLFIQNHIKDFENNNSSSDGPDIEIKPITNFLARHGMAFCGLKLAKGRDGMTRFKAALIFHFCRNKFEIVDWTEIRRLLAEEKNKKK